MSKRALVVVPILVGRHTGKALRARALRLPARLAAKGVVSIHAPGRAPRPHEPTAALTHIGVEDRPVVAPFSRARPVAFGAVQSIRFQAAIFRTAVVVIAVLGGVGWWVDVLARVDDRAHDWLEPTSPRNSHALRVRA